MEEPPRKTLVTRTGYTRQLIRIMKYCFLENTRLCLLIVYSGLMLGFNNGALWFYQPYFEICGLPVVYFGVAFASYQFCAAVSSKYAHVIESKIGPRYALIIIAVIVSTGYILMGHVVFLLSFIFAFFHQFARGFVRIVITDYINQFTESDTRATVLSAQNLMMRLFYALLIPFAGKLADLTSILQALQLLGVATLLVGSGMLIIMHRAKAL